MRKILIVGAGQSGLQLGLSLLRHGYDVTIVSARTPEEIRSGRVMSTQAMFNSSLQLERDQKINFWEEEAPKIQGIHVSLSAPPGQRALEFYGPLESYAQSVDQRLKMAGWLETFEEQGGNVVIHGATTADLDGFTRLYDLVIVAAGKGELVQLFDRDDARSPYSTPQRKLSVVYVHGLEREPHHPEPEVGINIVPGLGELFVIPGLTLSGPCDILFWEGIPGGPLDCWDDRPDPQEHLQRTLDLARQYTPWVYERCRNVELTDPLATLVGAYPPVVRRPVAKLPSGGAVLGMADVVVANDPITGQGSNNAAHCAAIYLQAIVERGDQPFDPAWMQATFDRYWEYASLVTAWTNAMLQPLPEHAQAILAAAATNPTVAARFANGFANPTDFQHWFMDPAKARAYLASLGA